MPLNVQVQELLDAAPHLIAAKSLSLDRITSARAALEPRRLDGLDVVAFGSLARLETTDESDFDYLVLSTGMPDRPNDALELLQAADDLRRRWATEGARDRTKDEVPKPGTSGVFGCAVGAFDLVHRIGLQDDTNHSLTRRMLLLEESVSLLNDAVHGSVLDATLKRYLEIDQSEPDKVPRFLLNDVTRYWHTMTVDYQAKARTDSKDSGLRYVKLIIPRKILFAGTLMSLLLCGKRGWHRATAGDLREQFRMTPLERLVQGHSAADPSVKRAFEGIIRIADDYLAKSGSTEWREKVKKASKSEPCEEFDEMRSQANLLQDHLQKIFFDWDLISADSRRMLVF